MSDIKVYKETKSQRKERIVKSGNSYITKVVKSKKIYNRKNKDYLNE